MKNLNQVAHVCCLLKFSLIYIVEANATPGQELGNQTSRNLNPNAEEIVERDPIDYEGENKLTQA